MAIRVRYFARIRDVMGASEEMIEADGALTSAAALLDALGARKPEIADALRHPSVRVEVNGVIGARSAFIRDGDEVAILPPFSGG
jgi:MoaD family protein